MPESLPFHARIYAMPAAVQADRPRELGSRLIAPLLASQADLMSSWPLTFEEAACRLSQLPRMFLEPDGSFVWVAEREPAWQIDGVLYDRGPQLAYVELRGSCPVDALESLLRTLGWPETQLVFELVAEGILLAEDDFRQLAGG